MSRAVAIVLISLLALVIVLPVTGLAWIFLLDLHSGGAIALLLYLIAVFLVLLVLGGLLSQAAAWFVVKSNGVAGDENLFRSILLTPCVFWIVLQIGVALYSIVIATSGAERWWRTLIVTMLFLIAAGGGMTIGLWRLWRRRRAT